MDLPGSRGASGGNHRTGRGRLRGRLRRRHRGGRRRRGRRSREDVAELDHAAGEEPRVVCDQLHPDGGGGGLHRPWRLLHGFDLRAEQLETPPVVEGDDRVRGGGDELPEHREALHRRRRDVARRARRPCGDACAQIDRLDRDLAVEERHRERADRGLGGRGDAGLGGRLRVGRPDAHDRAVLRVRVAGQDLRRRRRCGERERDLVREARLGDPGDDRGGDRLRLLRRRSGDRHHEGDEQRHSEERGASHRASG